jgi:hypothetical protein
MTDYLFLFRGPAGAPALSPEEMQRNMQKWMSWIEELAKAGRYKSGHPLDAGGKVVSGRAKVVTDGPFTESKEVVGGYLIVSAGSLDEAVGLSKGCPIFEGGGRVEVRAIQEM